MKEELPSKSEGKGVGDFERRVLIMHVRAYLYRKTFRTVLRRYLKRGLRTYLARVHIVTTNVRGPMLVNGESTAASNTDIRVHVNRGTSYT